MSDNLVHLIEENSEDSFYIDLIQHDLDWHLYHFGNHLKNKSKRPILDFYDLIQYVRGFISCLKGALKQENSKIEKVLSIVPFSMDDVISSMGFVPYSLPVRARKTSIVVKSWRLLYYNFRFDYIVKRHSFSQIIHKDLKFIKRFYSFLKQYVLDNEFDYLYVRTDQPFLERALLSIFKEANKPSFIFSHGIPADYNHYEDVLSTYVIVWGEKVKENYIANGISPQKVHVVGNVKYKEPLHLSKIKWDDSSILVAPESSIQGHHHSDPPELIDRNRVLVYLYEVEYILKEKGYKHAIYRPHPSFNRKWIQDYVDPNFYTIDTAPLSESAKKYSLVIGATSSVMLEYCLMGVNCFVYERKRDRLFPPFDGSDKRIPFASSPYELKMLFEKHATVSTDFINDYIQPFDVVSLKRLMKQ